MIDIALANTDDPSDSHEKRDLSLTTAFATYAIVNNVLNTAIERFWPNAAVRELQERDQQFRAGFESERELNPTKVLAEVLSNAVVNQAALIQHNSTAIERIRYDHPELTVLAAHLIAKVVTPGSLLDRLKIAFGTRRPDLQLISLIMGTNFLDDVEQDSIAPLSVRAGSPSGLITIDIVINQ